MTSDTQILSASGVDPVKHVLTAFSLVPLHAMATARDQSSKSLLQEMTGLSKARISKGNLDSIRPSTQQKIDRHQQQWLLKEMGSPEAVSRLNERFANAPLTCSGGVAPWAGWVYMLELLPYIPLPISTAVALAWDELIEASLSACRTDDLVAYKRVWLNHFEHHGLAVRIGDEPIAFPTASAEFDAVRSIETWADALKQTNTFMEHLYWDVVTALDAEWSSHYFSGRQTAPLFPLVMVRPQDGLLETGKVRNPKKNVIYRPVRRLLEFLYALMFYIRCKKWPEKKPGPRVLAEALDDPSLKIAMTPTIVSNHFDGSLNLTLDLVLDYWIRLHQHFYPQKNEQDKCPNPPIHMVILALQWQKLFVMDKGRKLFLPDLEKYDALWVRRHHQWKAREADGVKDKFNPSPLNLQPIEWPEWMRNQSASSSD